MPSRIAHLSVSSCALCLAVGCTQHDTVVVYRDRLPDAGGTAGNRSLLPGGGTPAAGRGTTTADVPSSGGSWTGGSATGGAPGNGGAAAGGVSSSNGSATGGAANNETTTGGTAFGGTATGGAPYTAGKPGSGGAQSRGGAGSGGTSGNGGSTMAAGAPHTGATAGSAGKATGGALHTGGMPGNGGSSIVGNCSPATNLTAEADKSDTHNWIGGDSTVTTDNPCGVQGAIFAYSDLGLDGIAGTSDDSVQTPEPDTASVDPRGRVSPCSGGKCCISGATRVWPKASNGTTDYTASVTGGGLGINLNDTGAGTRAYSGPAVGFTVKLSGSLNGQKYRVGYIQSATQDCWPFAEFSGATIGSDMQLPFTSAAIACPTWGSCRDCAVPAPNPYALRIEIVGGDVAGSFQLCIDSVTPIL
jgi:hypothetical protein